MNNEERNGLRKQRRLAREKCKKLQSNWNSLREWLEEEIEKVNGTEYVCFQKVYYEEVLDKMNELEGEKDNGTMD